MPQLETHSLLTDHATPADDRTAQRIARLEAQLKSAGETQRRTITELLNLHGQLSERNCTIARLQRELAEANAAVSALLNPEAI